MRWTKRLKLIPCGGAALSAALVALTRTDASVFDGLWQNTQYSVLLRSVPCMESDTWHWLQLASATTARRDTTGEPSTEKYDTGFLAPYWMLCCEVVPARTTSVRRASMPTA